eukprot:scaffold116175_cov28-Tisochrysis_lutea.AAC.4
MVGQDRAAILRQPRQEGGGWGEEAGFELLGVRLGIEHRHQLAGAADHAFISQTNLGRREAHRLGPKAELVARGGDRRERGRRCWHTRAASTVAGVILC